MSEQTVKCPICETPYIVYMLYSGDQSACQECRDKARRIREQRRGEMKRKTEEELFRVEKPIKCMCEYERKYFSSTDSLLEERGAIALKHEIRDDGSNPSPCNIKRSKMTKRIIIDWEYVWQVLGPCENMAEIEIKVEKLVNKQIAEQECEEEK